MGHIKWDKPGRHSHTHTRTHTQTHMHIDLRTLSQQKSNPNGFPAGIEVSIQ